MLTHRGPESSVTILNFAELKVCLTSPTYQYNPSRSRVCLGSPFTYFRFGYLLCCALDDVLTPVCRPPSNTSDLAIYYVVH